MNQLNYVKVINNSRVYLILILLKKIVFNYKIEVYKIKLTIISKILVSFEIKKKCR